MPICKRRPRSECAGFSWFLAATSLSAGSHRPPLLVPAASRSASTFSSASFGVFASGGSPLSSDPGSFRAFGLLGRFALDPCWAAFTLRPSPAAPSRCAPFGSLDLRFPQRPSRFACLARLAFGFSRQRRAPPSRQLLRLRSLDGFEPSPSLPPFALSACCAAFAPGFSSASGPAARLARLGCGFATRGLSPGPFSKRVELAGPVVCTP